jgi:MFS family permease
MIGIPAGKVADVSSFDEAITARAPRTESWHTLLVLIAAYVLAFVDRQILSLLVEPMKRDLHISDTQISLLQGLAFASLLAIAGLPLGRLADTGIRVKLIALGVVAWSLATAGCGLVSGYVGLLLCRMGVGLGEATLTPTAHSLIADSFSPRRLGLALGIFGVGGYIGAGLALVIGAAVIASLPEGGMIAAPLIGSLRPWQIVFLVIALPGLLVAWWMASRPEPPRQREHATHASRADIARYFRTHGRSLVLVNLSAACTGMAMYASGAWVPSFLIRTYGWTATHAGTAYGLTLIGGGIVGMVAGGAVGDLAVRRGRLTGRPLTMALAGLGAVPFAAAMLTDRGWLSLALIAPVTLLNAMALGVLPSAQQAIAPSQMRGIVAALGVLMVNMIGLGIGPTAVALLTDHVFGDPLKLRYALGAAVPVMLCAASLLSFASLRSYRRSVVTFGSGGFKIDPANGARDR